LWAVSVWAADLDAIRQTQAKLVKLRTKNDVTYPLPDPPPEFAELKHQIRDWTEEKIAKLRQGADLEAATSRTDNELSTVKLNRDDANDHDLGDIDGVQLSHPDGDKTWLMMTSDVWREPCTIETSIYLYEWQRDGWARRFELEEPLQGVKRVEVGQPDAYYRRLVLVLGNSWGCASMWQQFSYRLFRVGSSTRELSSGDDTVYFGVDDGEAYNGRLEPDGALMDYLTFSTDGSVLIRRRVLHLQIDGDTVTRVEPFALTAQDFVDDWLVERGKKSQTFDFIQHCPGNADRWQIGVSPNPYGDESADPRSYFMIEQLPEYHFRILDIDATRQPGCPGEDPPRGAGQPYPTLFPAARKP